MRLSRREFARLSSMALIGACAPRAAHASTATAAVLEEFPYRDVSLESALQLAQLQSTQEVLMGLSEDSLLKPFRQIAGQPAPGANLGGWYNYNPDYDWHRDDAGFAPGATFGQWVSALARYVAISGSPAARDKVLRLNRLYAATISEGFYERNRFPAYCYDKLLLGLIDAQRFASDPDAFAVLERTTAAALPHLPRAAIDRELPWRPGKDQSYRWDESYTNPENLLLAWQRGAGRRYRDLAVRYLDDATWFDPLARGENVLAGKHAYSYVNSLSSAMQAYLTLGSSKHLNAARNAFAMLSAQSYPTGGWGPDEKLLAADSDELYRSLTATHNSFETPCGAYAHFKLTRYLLRVSGDSRYGDSMERVMYNTVLGAKPLQADGRAFYYADYNLSGRKVYSSHRFPCCSGTLPQVATDYGINAYFRDAGGIYVNLYLPSKARFTCGTTRCSLRQSGDYPFADTVAMHLGTSAPQEFAVRVRIPAWASNARLEVNGHRWKGAADPGSFAVVARRWRDGDRLDLELPRRLALTAVDTRHPDTVALSCGPLVLFPLLPGDARPRPTRAELLAVRQVAPQRWQTRAAGAPLTLLPYVAIDAEPYTTFLELAG
ncbi:MAG: glycoside hydrolase family 127 protein [Gammaproteobacteria bacterium]|nr:glycoside hydrolase family 127 protein [Gammaproteobacteria bacterium]